MSRHSYCPDCGARNPLGSVYCSVCGENLPNNNPRQNPITSAAFANPKLAVFDIDMTVLDNRQRFKDAVRAGVADKAGKAVKKGFKAQQKRDEFLYSEAMLMKDTLIPGVKGFMQHLTEKGYTIAYCTSRPIKHREKTLHQLQVKDLPLYRDADGIPMLYMKSKLSQKTPQYKKGVLYDLMQAYDVHFFFDDRPDSVAEAAKLGIPGCYTKVSTYWNMISSKSNPRYIQGIGYVFVDEKGEPRRDPDNPDKWLLAEEDDDENNTPRQSSLEEFENPGHAPISLEMASDSIKGTKIVKKPGPNGEICATCSHLCNVSWKCHLWSKKKGDVVYVYPEWYCQGYQSVMKNPPVKPRKKGGRKEPAKSYIKRFMGDSKMNKEFPSAGQRYAVALAYVEKIYGKAARKRIAPRDNPGKVYCPKCEKYRSSQFLPLRTYEGEIMCAACEKREFLAQQLDDPAYKEFKTTGKGGNLYLGFPEGVNTNPGAQSKVEKILIKEGGAAGLKPLLEAFPKGTTKAQAKKAISQMTSVYQHPAGDYILESTVRPNPAHPSKVEKGKKLYEHMNGKEPAKIESTKVDIGDVWYQVGEGGCWQIGYMSGKETGNSAQKYTHNFNEETKDGDYPKLYATMPKKGKPMLIIKGGTWKIKTDDQGVAWIYD